MDITDIRIRKVNADGKLKAYVTVTFDDSFVVHNVKIIEGENGVFIAMPSRKTKSGEYKDVAHPINTSFRTRLQDRILEAIPEANRGWSWSWRYSDFDTARRGLSMGATTATGACGSARPARGGPSTPRCGDRRTAAPGCYPSPRHSQRGSSSTCRGSPPRPRVSTGGCSSRSRVSGQASRRRSSTRDSCRREAST